MGASGRVTGTSPAGKAESSQASRSDGGNSGDKPAREKIQRRTCLHKQLHKTKFCMYHLQGVCQYGDDCAFAHSCVELQATPDLRKTRLCKTYSEGSGCNDSQCPFAHGEEELRSTDMFYKKTLCIWNEKGKCRNGDQCRFAHGLGEMRANGLAVPPTEQVRRQADAPAGTPKVAGAAPGRRSKGASKSLPVAAVHDAGTSGRQEPMKVSPTRSLVDEAEAVLPFPGLPAAESQPDSLRTEIQRLQHVISALTTQCNGIRQTMYNPYNDAGLACLEVPFVGTGLDPVPHLAWQANQLRFGQGFVPKTEEVAFRGMAPTLPYSF